MKPKTETETEIRNQNRNPKLKSESETEIESESETGIGTETETEIEIPTGEKLMDMDKVGCLIGAIVDAASATGCTLLEFKQACKSVCYSTDAIIADSMRTTLEERQGEDA